MIIHDIMRKPNSIIVLLHIFHIIHPQKQKRSVQPFCFWGEHTKGLSNQADVELDMIKATIRQNSSSDLYLDELSVWRIIRLDGEFVSSINSANVSAVIYNT